MRNFINWYSSNKRISIPVTILVAALIACGTYAGVTNLNKPEETAAVSESVKKDAKEIATEYVCYDKAGKYSDKIDYKTGEITVDGVILENASFDNLTITETVGDGSVDLNNVKVNKLLVINGGGQNSVHINGGSYKEIVSNDYDCHIVVDEKATVETMTVLDSQLVDIKGTVTTANVIPTTYDGEVTWEHGIKAGEKATITTLNIPEEIADNVKVEDNSGAVKEQKQMDASQTQAVRAQATTATNTATQATSAAYTNAVNNGVTTNASNGAGTTANVNANANIATNTNSQVPSRPDTTTVANNNVPANNNGTSNNNTPARNKQDMGHGFVPEGDKGDPVYCVHNYWDGYESTEERYKCTMTTRVDHVLVEPAHDYQEEIVTTEVTYQNSTDPNGLHGRRFTEAERNTPEADAFVDECIANGTWGGWVACPPGERTGQYRTAHAPDRYNDETHYIYTCPHCGDKYEL